MLEYRFKTSSDLGQSDYGTNIVGIQVANGVNALLAYNPSCVSDPYSNDHAGVSLTGNRTNKNGSLKLSTTCLAVLYDTTGFSKPNENGKDLHGINVAFTEGICTEDNSVCFTGPAFVPTPIDCTNSSSEDWQYCLGSAEYSNDYFAGAVKACGGISKIPTAADLFKLAHELNTLVDAYEEPENYFMMGDLDLTKSAKYGITSEQSGIWSSSSFDESYSDAWSFNQGDMYLNSYLRADHGILGLCLGN